MNDWIFIGITAAVVAVFGYVEYTQGPWSYRGRKYTGKDWRREFPDEPKEKIRSFLECLVDGMAISSKARLKFRPEDKVIDIYRSLYRGKTPAGDNLECETFVMNLAAEFNVEEKIILDCWEEETTLGDLYQCIIA